MADFMDTHPYLELCGSGSSASEDESDASEYRSEESDGGESSPSASSSSDEVGLARPRTPFSLSLSCCLFCFHVLFCFLVCVLSVSCLCLVCVLSLSCLCLVSVSLSCLFLVSSHLFRRSVYLRSFLLRKHSAVLTGKQPTRTSNISRFALLVRAGRWAQPAQQQS